MIIRQDERKLSGNARDSLHNHRVLDIRPEARAALLAYGYLRNKPLSIIERPNSRSPDWKNTRRIAKSFGGDSYSEGNFDLWAGLEQRAKAA